MAACHADTGGKSMVIKAISVSLKGARREARMFKYV